jgi:hypothetical protein
VLLRLRIIKTDYEHPLVQINSYVLRHLASPSLLSEQTPSR